MPELTGRSYLHPHTEQCTWAKTVIWEPSAEGKGLRGLTLGPGASEAPTSFCAVGGAKAKSWVCASGGQHQPLGPQLSSTATALRACRPPGPPAAPLPLEAQETLPGPGLCRNALPISPPSEAQLHASSLVRAAPLKARAHKPLSEHFPPHSQMERSGGTDSALLISSLLGQECPALGLAHRRGLG